MKRRPGSRDGADAGFGMLEIVVAIALMGVAMAGVAPQMMASIRASGTAKLASQAKGVLQGQLDSMRTLPFRVAPSAGDHRDLLDTYFRNLVPPAGVPACGTSSPSEPLPSWTGFVAATSTARCPYEAAGVAMYRKVIAPDTGEVPPGFAVVLNTTFVAGTTTPTVLTPAAGYDTQRPGLDRPPSSQVGVTATVLYRDHARWKPVTAYTQMLSRSVAETRLTLDAHATAVEIGSARSTGESLTLTGGQLQLTGSLSTSSQARASVAALAGASSVGGRREGAALAAAAPYVSPAGVYAPPGQLEAGCTGPCWASSSVSPFVLAADNGLPRAGVSGIPGVLGPVRTGLGYDAGRDGFEFQAAAPTLPGLGPTLVSLDATPAPGSVLTDLGDDLQSCAFMPIHPATQLTGSGFINSTDDRAAANPWSAEACAGAHTDVIRVLPTEFAPHGLIRITARSAARCLVAGFDHTASTEVGYRAEVEFWKWTPTHFGDVGPVLGHGEYVSAGVITPSTTVDPLAALPLDSFVTDHQTLGDYIESMSGLTADRVTATAGESTAEVTIPALVTVQTRPVAGSEHPATAVSVAVGAAGCRAEDHR